MQFGEGFHSDTTRIYNQGQNTREDALTGITAAMFASEGKNYVFVIYKRRILPPLETIRVIIECQQKETLTVRIMVMESNEIRGIHSSVISNTASC